MSSSASARHVGYDMLRTLACMMVVILHASAQYWYLTPPSEGEWALLHIWNTSARCAVPIFFMISGALFLHGPRPGKKFFTRNIPRLACVFIVWSVLYGIDAMTVPGVLADPLKLFDHAMAGHYHLWFLPSMIGVYLLLPALYAIAHYENGWALRAFLPVFLIFGIICGTAAAFDGMLPWGVSVAFAKIAPELCGCCGYFLLGFALTNIDVSRVPRTVWILICILSVGITAAVGILYSRHTGRATALLHGEFTLPTFAEAVSLFFLFRTVKVSPASRTGRLFTELSACTLGIYLLHPFVMERLQAYGFDSLFLHAGIGVPLLSFAVILICLTVSAFLRRIPVVGKWIL